MVGDFKERRLESICFSGKNDAYIHIEVKDGAGRNVIGENTLSTVIALAFTLRDVAENVAKETEILAEKVKAELYYALMKAYESNKKMFSDDLGDTIKEEPKE